MDSGLDYQWNKVDDVTEARGDRGRCGRLIDRYARNTNRTAVKDVFSRLMGIRPNTVEGNQLAWACPHWHS